MKAALILLPLMLACGGNSDPQDAATETQPIVAICQLDSGFGIYCNQWTPNDQAWAWMDVDGGFHLCNDQVVCPSGTPCTAINTTTQEQTTLTGQCQ